MEQGNTFALYLALLLPMRDAGKELTGLKFVDIASIFFRRQIVDRDTVAILVLPYFIIRKEV
jgi:hypothetical protein